MIAASFEFPNAFYCIFILSVLAKREIILVIAVSTKTWMRIWIMWWLIMLDEMQGSNQINNTYVDVQEKRNPLFFIFSGEKNSYAFSSTTLNPWLYISANLFLIVCWWESDYVPKNVFPTRTRQLLFMRMTWSEKRHSCIVPRSSMSALNCVENILISQKDLTY